MTGGNDALYTRCGGCSRREDIVNDEDMSSAKPLRSSHLEDRLHIAPTLRLLFEGLACGVAHALQGAKVTLNAQAPAHTYREMLGLIVTAFDTLEGV